MSILKELLEIIKAKNEYKRDYRRLKRAAVDYAALKNMVNEVEKKNVVIDIVTDDGVKMTIRPERVDNQIGYESFQERYNRSRQ